MLVATLVTFHFSIPELIIVVVVLAVAALRELAHLLRANGDELLEFLRWWASFRKQLAGIHTSRSYAEPSRLCRSLRKAHPEINMSTRIEETVGAGKYSSRVSYAIRPVHLSGIHAVVSESLRPGKGEISGVNSNRPRGERGQTIDKPKSGNRPLGEGRRMPELFAKVGGAAQILNGDGGVADFVNQVMLVVLLASWSLQGTVLPGV